MLCLRFPGAEKLFSIIGRMQRSLIGPLIAVSLRAKSWWLLWLCKKARRAPICVRSCTLALRKRVSAQFSARKKSSDKWMPLTTNTMGSSFDCRLQRTNQPKSVINWMTQRSSWKTRWTETFSLEWQAVTPERLSQPGCPAVPGKSLRMPSLKTVSSRKNPREGWKHR